MEKKPVVEIDNKSEISFPKRGSFYYIGTAGQRAFGRGDTIDRAHLSEAAYYLDLARILGGIQEAAEYGQIDVETTANGRSNEFYDMWVKAKRGQSSFVPIFIPWFIDQEYSSDNLLPGDLEKLSPAVREMFAIPDNKFPLSRDEKELMIFTEKHWNIRLTIGQMKWRRYKIWDLGDTFQQEYPENDVDCFLQSGRPVFRNITTIESIRQELQAGVRYYAGLDGAEGVAGGDNHCLAIIDPRNIEADPEKGVRAVKPHVCLEIVSNDPIDVFDKKVSQLCEKYDIILAVEKQGVGAAHILKLKDLGVSLHEWNTTSATRPVMITDLEEAYRKEDLIETYKEAEDEAKNMFYDSTNKAVHPTGKHDDRVFARAIAWQALRLPEPSLTFL